MRWLKRVGVVAGTVLAILALVPFFVTLDDYIPRVEQELAAALSEPVSIDSLHASAFPVPHARIAGITVGVSDDIRIGSVSLTPKLWSLLRPVKVIRRVDVDDLVLSQKALGTLIALAQQNSGTGSVRVESIRLRGATLKLGESSLGPLDIKVRISSPEVGGEIELASRDGALKARVSPEGEQYMIAASARSWVLPVGPPIRFDELDVKGVARSSHAEFTDVSGKLYGGTVAGRMSAGWSRGVTIKGNLDLKQIELRQAAPLLSPKTRVSGRLDAAPVFSSRADTAAQLGEALRIEAPFTVHKGVLYGFDLTSAATRILKPGAGGGETRFDEFSGHLALERRAFHFTKLKIASGVLSARGNVTISPSKALSGQLNTAGRGSAGSASIPVTVAGTLDTPLLYPNGTALAGAAAGTVLLGPGVGTAAGAKLGEFVDGLFGKKKP